MRKTKVGQLVQVTWEDHYSQPGWQKESDETPVIVTSVGYIRKETPKMLIIGQNYSEKDAASGNHMGIIKNCIKSRKVVK